MSCCHYYNNKKIYIFFYSDWMLLQHPNGCSMADISKYFKKCYNRLQKRRFHTPPPPPPYKSLSTKGTSGTYSKSVNQIRKVLLKSLFLVYICILGTLRHCWLDYQKFKKYAVIWSNRTFRRKYFFLILSVDILNSVWFFIDFGFFFMGLMVYSFVNQILINDFMMMIQFNMTDTFYAEKAAPHCVWVI